MAKINIEIDTEEATVMASIDGQQIENVSSIYVYKYHDSYEDEDEVSVRVSTMTKNEGSDVVKTEDYMCCDNKLVPAVPKVHQDIANFLGKK